MNDDLPVLWSPAQQAWLQAMGYTVYHDGALAAEMDAALQLSVAQAADREAARADEGPVMPSRPVDTGRPQTAPPPVQRRAVAAPSAPDDVAAAPAQPRTRSGGRQPSVRLPDRLQMALLRASGCNPNDPQTLALMDSWPLDALRGNPAAKRALWPTLRALRRKEPDA